jgi:hypothetical protein
MRALVQLEDAGHATRHHGTHPNGGGHYLWRAISGPHVSPVQTPG